jgi:hypothetical protein
MRRIVLALIVGLVLAAPAAAQPMPKPPGPEHALLKQFEGEWEATVKLGGKEEKGTMSAKMDFNGYFLIYDFKSMMFGMTFHGRATVGYDPAKKKYASSWIDNMSPTPALGSGSFDKAGKIFTDDSEHADESGKVEKMTMTYEFKTKDTIEFIMYVNEGGKKIEMMRIDYKRKK